jgi:hypothetical protein
VSLKKLKCSNLFITLTQKSHYFHLWQSLGFQNFCNKVANIIIINNVIIIFVVPGFNIVRIICSFVFLFPAE